MKYLLTLFLLLSLQVAVAKEKPRPLLGEEDLYQAYLESQKMQLEEVSANEELAAKLTQTGFRAYQDIINEPTFSCLVWSPSKPCAPKLPLLVYVPGNGQIGTNLMRQFKYPALIDQVTSSQFQKKFPCHFLALSPPTNITSFAGGSIDRPNKNQKKLQELVECAIPKFWGSAVDTNRIYLTGFSYGGSAAFMLMTRYPHFYAACAPISGVVPATEFATVKQSVWYFHNVNIGDEDTPTNRHLFKYQKLATEACNDFRIGEYPRGGHDAWHVAWREDSLWEWIFSKSLKGAVPRPHEKNSLSIAHRLSLHNAKARASQPGIDEKHGPERAIDTLDSTAYIAAQKMTRDDWWEVEFASPLRGKITITSGDESGNHKLISNAYVEISKDGKNWERAMNFSKKGLCVFTPRTPIQFVRVRVTSVKPVFFALRDFEFMPE